MDTLEKLLFNLQTIASIPKGKRITTAQEFINIEDESMLQSVWRTIARDSRTKAVLMVQRTVELVIFISDLMLESKYLFLKNVSNDFYQDDLIFEGLQMTNRDKRLEKIKYISLVLDESKVGIENLCETYIDDSNVIAVLRPLVANIENHICKINNVLISIGEILKKRYILKI